MMLWGNLRTHDKIADRKKKSWGTFKNKMVAERRKTGDGGGKKNDKGDILERRISSTETEFKSIWKSSKIHWSGALLVRAVQ